MAFDIKQGDTEPSIEAEIRDGANPTDDEPEGPIINLTGYTVAFNFRPERKGGQLRTGSAVVVDAVAGLVRYDFVSGDTDIAGVWDGEFVATRTANGKQRTFPSGNAVVVWTVRPRLASD